MVAKIMKLFENYNTAKQKYGEELANNMLQNGISNEYVNTACIFYTEDNIPKEVLQQKFRQWMSYIRNSGKETLNVNNLSYQQFDNIIRGEIQKAAIKPTLISLHLRTKPIDLSNISVKRSDWDAFFVFQRYTDSSM